MASGGAPFIKMHGLGNDFVVFDARAGGFVPNAASARAIADRRTGVGCDSVITLLPGGKGDAFMEIRNADGGMSSACGNAARCVAALVMAETGLKAAMIESDVGILPAHRGANGLITIDMGPANLEWRQIPLAEARDTLHLGLSLEGLEDPAAVSMGNPHMVFFVPDAEAVDLESLGPRLEHHPLFPARTNVEVVQVLGPNRLRMRVWERGVGITPACGTGACATLVAAARRGLSGRKGEVIVDGGTLGIEWRSDNHVLLTGPVAESYRGVLSRDLMQGSLPA